MIRREMESVCADFLGRGSGAGDVVWESLFVEKNRGFTGLVADNRIYQVVCDLIGEDMLWAGSEIMCGFNDRTDHLLVRGRWLASGADGALPG